MSNYLLFIDFLILDKNLEFPKFYPTGCVLGCVSVDDCLAQEDYQEKLLQFYDL